MEELRSTEILDKEIEADARKKAKKIIEKSEFECSKIIGETEEKVKAALQKKRKFYEEKLAVFAAGKASYIPLEKERFLAEFYDEQVSAALNNYFSDAGKEKRLLWLEKKLEACRNILPQGKVLISFFGTYDEVDAKKIAEKFFNDSSCLIKKISFEQSGEEGEKGNSFHEGFIIESEKGDLKIRLTLDEVIRELKDRYSEELAVTLFKGSLPK